MRMHVCAAFVAAAPFVGCSASSTLKWRTSDGTPAPCGEASGAAFPTSASTAWWKVFGSPSPRPLLGDRFHYRGETAKLLRRVGVADLFVSGGDVRATVGTPADHLRRHAGQRGEEETQQPRRARPGRYAVSGSVRPEGRQTPRRAPACIGCEVGCCRASRTQARTLRVRSAKGQPTVGVFPFQFNGKTSTRR